MITFKNELWSQLLEPKAGPCVSLYLPYGVGGKDRNEMRIHRKNLLNEACEILQSSISDQEHIQPIVDHLIELQADDHNAENGIYTKVFFISSDFFKSVNVPVRLKPILKINRQFFLSPLLHMLSEDVPFYLLNVSKNGFQLFHRANGPLETLELEVPSGLIEYYGAEPNEWSFKSFLAIRDRFVGEARPLAQTRGGRYMGLTSDENRIADADLELYLRHIDQVVCHNIEQNNLPLILLGNDEICQKYKAISRYPYLKERHISGQVSEFKDAELLERGLEIAREDLVRLNETLVQEYFDAIETDLATDDYRILHQAASNGLIKTLLVCDTDVDLVYSPSRSKHYKDITDNRLTAAAEDLIDEVTFKTFMTGGKIVWRASKDMPNQGILAGVLRTSRETLSRMQH